MGLMVLDPVLAIRPPSTTEWLIILAVVVLLFGGAKIPELARSLGKAKSEFQKGIEEGEQEASAADDEDAEDDETPAAATP